MNSTDTRERLLEAAERLFAAHGIDGTSLRAITAEAEANVAAVNYHFQSKEGLVAAVFERRIQPMIRERLRLLDVAESDAAPRPPVLDAIIRAFISPPLRLSHDSAHGGEHFMSLMGRMFDEPGEVKLLVKQFRDTAERFAAALHRALPDLPHAELMWRLHFLVGGLAHIAAMGDLIRAFSQGACDPADVEGTIDRLTAFAAAGFRAPLAGTAPTNSDTERVDP